jgi:hypothetical protein
MDSHHICDTIKYKVVQNKETKDLELQILRPYGDNNEWVIVDHFNEITTLELKCLTEYLISLFKKKT